MDPIASKGMQGLSNVAGELAKAGDVGKKGAPGKFEQVRAEKLSPGETMDKLDRQLDNFSKTGKMDQQPREMTMAQRVAARDGISMHPNQVPGAEGVGKADGAGGAWKPQQVQATGQTQKVAEGLKDFDASQKRLDEIMGELKSGKKYSHEELISLQMEVNVLSEQVQMTTKLVDSATQSIKQVMQQQV